MRVMRGFSYAYYGGYEVCHISCGGDMQMKERIYVTAAAICCAVMLIATSCGQQSSDNPASPGISSLPSIAPISSAEASSSETESSDADTSSSETASPAGPTNEEMETALAALINNARASYGLAPYDFNDAQLNETASIRAQELAQSYSHTRPDGTPCTTAFPEYGAAGENMSCDYNTPENVYTYWMASPTNRSNILDEQNYHYSKASVKVNIAEDGTYYWVMCVMATLEDVGPYVPPVSSAVSSPAA